MPFANWTEAKARLDQMIAAVTPDELDASVKTFERRYGERYFKVTITEDGPLYTYGVKEVDQWQAINIIKTWDQPDRAVIK